MLQNAAHEGWGTLKLGGMLQESIAGPIFSLRIRGNKLTKNWGRREEGNYPSVVFR